MRKIKKMLAKTKAKLQKLYGLANRVLFKKLPSALGTPLAAILIVAPVVLGLGAYYLGKNKHPSSYTVMITNMEGTGGGSGVVIENSRSESVILSNEHVCSSALKKGGKVKLVSGQEHAVTGYLTDIEHDLCVLTVAADLKTSVKIAEKSPEAYSQAVVTGHPALMPNVITNGHFGGKQIISVMVGVRRCTEADMKKQENAMFCMFFGVVPIIRNYESQVVTATIMGGSSGSAVLNDKGELSGLVFAGKGKGLSYAYIVPYEAVRNFVDGQAKTIKKGNKYRPWLYDRDFNIQAEEESVGIQEIGKSLQKQCVSEPPKQDKLLEFCQDILSDIRM